MPSETEDKPKNLVDFITPEIVSEGDPEPVVAAVQEPTPEPEPVATEKEVNDEDVIGVLESRHDPVLVVLTYGGREAAYVQKPLTYFRKMEFFGLVGETLDRAMEGEDGLSVNAVFGTDAGLLGAFNDLDSFLALAGKIAHYVPSFLKDAYLVILNVPRGDRPFAREALDELSDEEGLAIAERFIDQNWESIRHFFGEQVPKIVQKVQAKPKD